MTNSNSQVRESNDNSIVLIVNNQSVPLALPLLMQEEIRQQLRAFCANAQQITVCDWQRIVVSPSEVSRFFLQLISESGAAWHFRTAGCSEVFVNPLDATLSAAIDRTDLSVLSHATEVAIAAAANVCPGAASEAANRVREWLARNGIHADSAKSIAAQIRRNCPEPDSNERLNPQDAARMVLAHMQSERDARGETEVTA